MRMDQNKISDQLQCQQNYISTEEGSAQSHQLTNDEKSISADVFAYISPQISVTSCLSLLPASVALHVVPSLIRKRPQYQGIWKDVMKNGLWWKAAKPGLETGNVMNKDGQRVWRRSGVLSCNSFFTTDGCSWISNNGLRRYIKEDRCNKTKWNYNYYKQFWYIYLPSVPFLPSS